MADKQSQKSPSTPPRFADTTPTNVLGIDHSFTLQTMLSVKEAIGELKQSVDDLKKQSDKHDIKLDGISKDVHTWKVTVRVVGLLLAGAITFLGWIVGKAVDVYVISHPQIQQSAPKSP